MGLGARLAIVFATVAAATALLVGAASYVTADRQVIAEIDSFLKERVDEITGGQREQRNGRGNDGRNNGDDGDATLTATAPDVFSPDSEVQFLDREGNVTSRSGSTIVIPVDEIDIEIADRDVDTVIRTIDIDGTDFRLITEHIDGVGAVQVARSLDESVGLLGVLQTRLVFIALSLALLAGAVGWIVAQRTTRPLRALTNAVDEVAETRNFSVPVPAKGNDEVGRLAGGFNRMLDALQLSQMQQRRLVQDAAHELRTPLTSITVNVDWLMMASDLDENARTETLGGIRRELTALNGVIAEIIDVATDSYVAAEFVPTDLVSVANDAIAQFHERTGREVTVNAQPTRVMGDPASLDRAITNLLSNADKYSPANGAITVDVANGSIFVNDSGPGIPEADRQLVFLRFYRRDNDRSKPGSGLGLSIVSSIVEHHGGRVDLGDSSLGGARIGFVLPEI